MRLSFVPLLVVALAGLPACPPGVPPLRLIHSQSPYGTSAFRSCGCYSATQFSADSFVLASGLDTIRLIQWWGHQAADATEPDSFLVRIYGDDGTGLPREYPLYSFPVVAPTREATGDVADSGNPIYEYSIEVLPIPLDAGTTYFLSIVKSSGAWSWMMTTEDPASEQLWFYPLGGPEWVEVPGNLAFQLWQ